jgi:hypothetical protein
MRTLTILLILAFCAAARAAPEVPPNDIYGIYAERVQLCFSSANSPTGTECEGETLNHVLVAPLPTNGVRVEVSLVFLSGHFCVLREGGEWRKDRVVVTMFYQDHGERKCELELYFTKKGVRLNDVEDKCRITTCGARGGYTGVQLPKKGSF